MSDGVDTFFNNGDKIPVDEIIKSLTEFKNTNGTLLRDELGNMFCNV